MFSSSSVAKKSLLCSFLSLVLAQHCLDTTSSSVSKSLLQLEHLLGSMLSVNKFWLNKGFLVAGSWIARTSQGILSPVWMRDTGWARPQGFSYQSCRTNCCSPAAIVWVKANIPPKVFIRATSSNWERVAEMTSWLRTSLFKEHIFPSFKIYFISYRCSWALAVCAQELNPI